MVVEIPNLIWTPSPESIQKEREWILNEAESVGLKTLQELALIASRASTLSYSPQSHYPVGAAILTASGKINDGQNIEITTYSETGHAEEQAIKIAVSSGAVRDEGEDFLRAVAVSHKEDTAPCGRCRQIIVEFSNNALVIVADLEGNIRSITSSRILLPYAFTPTDLERAQSK